jgi:hypothetical protein
VSIYATLEQFGIKRFGDGQIVEIYVQAVPPHITRVDGIYAFLPPPVDPESDFYRAVFFIEEGDEKGTARSHQEYAKPLLMLTGEEYERITFKDLMKRLDESLDRKYGRRPGAIFIKPDGSEQRLY